MSKLKVLIVDDEYLALNLLSGFVKQISDLELVDSIKNPLEALQVLGAKRIDILFLDIQMPALSGVNLLKSLKNPPVVIFTTAYSDYALEAFDLNAVDYLLKPFSFERFLQAVNKAKELCYTEDIRVAEHTGLEKSEFITVKAEGKIIKIFTKDILYIEGMKEYIRFRCKNDNHMVFERMKNIEKLLSSNFIRVHKSFIIAKDKVTASHGNQLEIGTYKIPISRDKKEDVISAVFGD
ncbi:LytR/AlgR family response regulator transcription factor [Psychroserpens ponticola]|uniref:Response regulator transcription factor n=1 Tax=Psychroserpens ponticola TaxID=2932268 RepID=A0ABY7S0H1_9FLAO|nr:response regulator transcription factor [Psychroserpens ponticola]WCO02797.1 response regulator transcription factor [Psychroserpens ponticola]